MPTATVPATTGNRLALGRIGCADRDHMLIVMPLVGMVQVAIVEVVDMVIMANTQVAAVRAVDVGVIGMG